MTNYCLNCSKAIKTFPSLNQRFCSKKCYTDAHRIERTCLFCKKIFTVQKALLKTHPAKYCSLSCRGKALNHLYSPFVKGHPFGKRFEKGNIPWHTGKKGLMPPPWNKGKKWLENSGPNHFAWKGGTYDRDRKIDWGRKFYRDWRKAVLERDDYQCTNCGNEHYLEVDHIKPYSLFPELRYNVDNGRVLCHSCHVITSTYGNRFLNLKETLLRES